MTAIPNDPAPSPLVPVTATQSGRATLYLDTAGLGCSRLRLPAGPHTGFRERPARRVPFRLGPLECEAIVEVPQSVHYDIHDGLTTTSWDVKLVGVPESFTVADLLEALGVEVTR